MSERARPPFSMHSILNDDLKKTEDIKNVSDKSMIFLYNIIPLIRIKKSIKVK